MRNVVWILVFMVVPGSVAAQQRGGTDVRVSVEIVTAASMDASAAPVAAQSGVTAGVGQQQGMLRTPTSQNTGWLNSAAVQGMAAPLTVTCRERLCEVGGGAQRPRAVRVILPDL